MSRPRRRPRIGVTTSRGGGRYMWWFYWLSMHLLGASPVRLVAPLDTGRLEGFDGFIIGGGDDIAAELYGAQAPLEVKFDPERDAMELAVLEHAVPRDLPVLGVCRGAQMLNVYMGGTLHQDMRAAYDGVPRMWTPLPRKLVRLREGTRLCEIMGRDMLDVNSLHNQAIDLLGEGLVVSGRDEYGVVQAVEDASARFRAGVQWHPEFLIYRATQRRLFRAFIDAVEQEAA
jgi:putative glutamine amidotransferase